LQSLGNIKLFAIISCHGFVNSIQGPPWIRTWRPLQPLSAALNISAESTTKRLINEVPNSIIVKTDENSLITYSVGPNALIAVLSGKEGGPGLILNDLKKSES